MHPLELKVRKTIINRGLLLPHTRVMVGFSGGADSTALLHILASLRAMLSFSLVAVYIDHGLRPSEVPAEISFVHQTAASLGIPCAERSIPVRTEAANRKLSLEHAARELRYQAFSELAQTWNTQLLALAHTADDQVEEVLLRLLRGSSRKALSGMRVRSDFIIRPLLGIRKLDLLSYLADKKVGFCHDSSNDDPHYLRNRIRHYLLPLLERDYDPGVRSALRKTAENLAEDEALLETLLEETWTNVVSIQVEEGKEEEKIQLSRASFKALHPALQRRLLEKLLWRIGSSARYQHIMILLEAAQSGRTHSNLHLGQGLRVQVLRETLVFCYPKGKGGWRGELH